MEIFYKDECIQVYWKWDKLGLTHEEQWTNRSDTVCKGKLQDQLDNLGSNTMPQFSLVVKP